MKVSVLAFVLATSPGLIGSAAAGAPTDRIPPAGRYARTHMHMSKLCSPQQIIRVTNKFNALANGGSNDDPTGTGYTAPDTDLPADRDKPIVASIQAAFNLLDKRNKIQKRLCDLTYILIDRSKNISYPYAFWESDGQAATANHKDSKGNLQNWTFIGIPATLFEEAGQPKTFAAYEQSTIRTIISPIGDDANLNARVSIDPDTKDGLPLMLLAVMSHELGHILWHKFGFDQANPRVKCDGNAAFWRYTWNNNRATDTLFHQFNTPAPNDRPIVGVTAGDVKGDSGNLKKASDDLATLYAQSQFASAFATLAQDEDFAETVKYSVLLDPTNPAGTGGAVLNDVQVTFGNQQVGNQQVAHRADDAKGSNLAKMGCIRAIE